MKKFLFIGSILLMLFLMMWPLIGNYYVDNESLNKSFTAHLPFLITGAILLGIVYLIIFARIFPKGWQDQTVMGQFSIVIIFLVLAFVVMRKTSVSLNLLLSPKSKERFTGIVFNKRIERGSKGWKFYHVQIKEISNLNLFEFDVSKKIYQKSKLGDTLNKDFMTGFFSIKYMND